MTFAEIISIGNELLIGQTINTNAAWMGEQLNAIGTEVSRVVVIADNEDAIVETLNESIARADIILLTGGLGPTSDDITKKVLARYFKMPLVMNKEVLEDVENIFRNKKRSLLEVNRLQAEVPEGCDIIRNRLGTAPGMCFWKENKMIVSMPGVPYEMRAMMRDFVLPKIQSVFKLHTIFHKTILTHGMGESSLADLIKNWEKSLLSESISLAYLPSPGLVKLRITLRGTCVNTLHLTAHDKINQLKELAGHLIFGFDNDSLEKIIGELLKAKEMTVGTAESCTGGYIAHLLTSVAGSSVYFKGGIVSYANDIKEKNLGVKLKTLTTHGAVSQEVVEQMALGAKKTLGVDYAISTSGVAGPDGGTEEKPVGTVWIALATPNKIISKKFVFGKSRKLNIKSAAMAGLNMLRQDLID